jgi:HpcH/HpaI aldolase/citrate lyase family
MSGAYLPIPQKSPTPSTEAFVLTLWTDDPELAARADAAGVNRIGVDLERLGKSERQRGMGTWISPHGYEDLDAVAAALSNAELFARLDPFHAGTARQLDEVLDRRGEVVMLPMAESPSEAREFTGLVDGAATVVLLVETREGIRRLPELVGIDGVDEVHIGLNDLALSLGVRNRWLALAGDLVVRAGSIVTGAGKRFGLGAVGRPGDRGLPIPVDLVYAQYPRTGATAALLSRSFFRDGPGEDLATDVALLRSELSAWSARDEAERTAAHAALTRCAARAGCF